MAPAARVDLTIPRFPRLPQPPARVRFRVAVERGGAAESGPYPGVDVVERNGGGMRPAVAGFHTSKRPGRFAFRR